MILEQKQCSSSSAWRASSQYKTSSDNACVAAGAQDLNPLTKRLCSRRHLPNLRFGIRSIRVDQDFQ